MNENIETRFLDLSHEVGKLRESTKQCLLKLEADIEKLEEFVSNMDYEQEQLIKKVSTLENDLDDFKCGNDYVTSDDLTNACDDLEDRINILEVEIDNLQKD
jgi:predicted  nucleic acid-binding Zn-ribbon protein